MASFVKQMLMTENRLDNDHMGSFHNANVLNCFKISDHDETRTRNLLIRSQTPYPLGHAVIEEIRWVESIRTSITDHGSLDCNWLIFSYVSAAEGSVV